MKSWIKLYNYWKPVKDIFVKPRLKVYFGKWANDPCLPVWRHGPIIQLYKSINCEWQSPILTSQKSCRKVYPILRSISIPAGTREITRDDGSTYTCGCFTTSVHKLPESLKFYDFVWRRDIRKKLKKWHLSWITPRIMLPIWLSFHIFNWDLGWKTKWDEYRYEWPPQFTIVFFGLSLTFYLVAPKTPDNLGSDDGYWESILYYTEPQNKDKSIYDKIKHTIESTGTYTKSTDNYTINYFSLRPEFLNENYLGEYIMATEKIKNTHKNKNKKFI